MGQRWSQGSKAANGLRAIAALGLLAVAVPGCSSEQRPPSASSTGPGCAAGTDCQVAAGDSCGSGDVCESGTHCGEAGLCISECSEGKCSNCDSTGHCLAVNPLGELGDDSIFKENIGAAPDAGQQVCVDLDVEFQRVTPTVVLLIDQSGSMTEAFPQVDPAVTKSRWDTVVETLSAPDGFLSRLQHSVQFGVALYTSYGGYGGGRRPRACPVLEDVAVAKGNFDSIVSLLQLQQPARDTPTAESLRAVAEELAAFEGDGPKSIILATDGDPDTCEDPDSNDAPESKALSIEAVTAAYEMGITTRVISVGDEVTASHLEELAVAGAGGDDTAEAYQALDTRALEAAFNEIIGTVRTCDLELEGTVAPQQAARGTLEMDGDPLVYQDPNGWEMPNERTVRLLGTACERAQQDAASISIRFPCDAIQLTLR